jgi:predicted Zn-dependent peptidase
MEDSRTTQPQVQIQQNSSADEILKYKNLLDMGVITQEEFEQKKKQLLGL